MIKCAVLVGNSHTDSGGRIWEENGPPLRLKKLLLLKQSFNWSSAAVILRTDAQTNDACLKSGVEPALNSVLAVTVMIPEKMHVKILIH